jgi:tetratricopeptide (TPR) repeat protein
MKDMKEIEDLLYVSSVIEKANECLENFQYDEVIKLLKNIPESLPDELKSAAITTLGDAYLHKGDYSQAITLLNKALQHIPHQIKSQSLSLLAQSYFWNKQYEESITAVKEKIKLKEGGTQTSPEIYLFVDYNLLGDAHLQLGNYKNAIKAFEKALSLKADFEEARHNLTFTNFKQNQQQNPNFKPNSAIIKNEVQWWIFFGTRVQAEGVHTGVLWKFDWGIMSLNKALEYDPENDDTKRGLEVFNYNRGLYTK